MSRNILLWFFLYHVLITDSSKYLEYIFQLLLGRGINKLIYFFSFQSQLYGATSVFLLNLDVAPHLIGFGIGQKSAQKMTMSVLKL